MKLKNKNLIAPYRIKELTGCQSYFLFSSLLLLILELRDGIRGRDRVDTVQGKQRY